jgi:4-amino-4-deoxy-L-arabinose transferase-like glycosyltransferase
MRVNVALSTGQGTPGILTSFKFTWRETFLLLLVFLGLWLPRAFRLEKFVTTDEVVWLWRSANFYYALGQHDFPATYLNNSPGVVTMWIDTIAFLLKFPQYRGFGQGMFDKYSLMEKFLLARGIHPHELLITSRILMVLLNTAILTAVYLLARRLVGVRVALTGLAIIALDPFHIAVTRLAHLDGPLSSFLFLSVLSCLVYLEERRPLFLFISAAAGGIAMLAKLPGWITVPIILLESLLWYLWLHKGDVQGIEKTKTSFWRNFILPMGMWLIAFTVILYVFFPAMWTKPMRSIERLVSSPLVFAEHVVSKSSQINMEESDTSFIFEDRPTEYFLRYPLGYIWRITPLILLGLCITIIAFVGRFGILGELKIRRVVIGLLLSVIIYTIFLTIPPKSSDKYYIPVYPIMDLLSGIGVVVCADWIYRLINSSKKHLSDIIILALIVVQAIQIFPTFPYYFTYFNPLLGGSRRAGELFNIGSGEGLDQAAEYLNNKPNASKLKVMSWYGIGPFSYYFVGKTILISKGTIWGEAETEKLREMDYLVTYNNQWRRFLPTGLCTLIEGIEPEHRIWINDIEYARIYNVKAFPPETFPTSP